MMKKITLAFLFQMILLAATAQVITYPAPKGSALNMDYTVKVRPKGGPWEKVATYNANVVNVIGTKSVIENTSFGYFDINGEADVSITWNKGTIKTVRVRPLADNIVPF
jgi:hypothetical protein